MGGLIAVPLLCWLAAAPPAPPPPDPGAVRAAVQKALPLLEKSSAEYTRMRGCFSCHHQAVPVLALAAARQRGFAVDEQNFRAQLRFTAHSLAGARAGYEQGRGQGGEVVAAGYALLALATGRWPADDTTGAVAHYLAVRDQDLDHWRTLARRPPMEASDLTATFLALRALRSYGRPADRAQIARRTARARAWLLAASPRETEDRVFHLQGLREIGAPADRIRAAAAALLAGQRPDG